MCTTVVSDTPSVLGFATEEWRGLESGLYSSHAWHRFQEIERADVASSYLLARENDRLAAVLPMYRAHRVANPNYRLRHLFPQALATEREPVLLGNRHGYNNTVLVDSQLPSIRQRAILDSLLAAARTTLRPAAGEAAWWPFLDDRSMRILRPLVSDAVPVAMKGECAIPLPGNGFADYLESLSRGRRAAVRADRKRFAAAGYQIRTQRLSDSIADIARLGVETTRKYGGGLDVRAASELTTAQAEVLDDISTVLTCVRDRQVLGFALIMDYRETSYLRAVGFDYRRAGNAAEYFELTFYRPIERAYSLGLKQLSVGASSYRAKVLRGGLLHARWALPLQTSGWPEAAARHQNAEQLRWYEKELASLESAIPYAAFADYC